MLIRYKFNYTKYDVLKRNSIFKKIRSFFIKEKPKEYINKDVTVSIIEDILLEYIENGKYAITIHEVHEEICVFFDTGISGNTWQRRYIKRFAKTIVDRIESFGYKTEYNDSRIDVYKTMRGTTYRVRFSIVIPKFVG